MGSSRIRAVASDFGSARFARETFRQQNFGEAWALHSVSSETRGSKNHGEFLDSWRLRALTGDNAKYAEKGLLKKNRESLAFFLPLKTTPQGGEIFLDSTFSCFLVSCLELSVWL